MGFALKSGLARVLAGVVVLAGSGAAAGEPEYWIVVHPDNPAMSLPRDEVSRLFLKKDTRWADGSPVAPVDLVRSAPARAAFSNDIHGRSPALVKKYWQKMVFGGRAAPPPEVATEDEVLAFVRGDPAAIGYVSDEAVLRGVKILDVIDPAPAPSPSPAPTPSPAAPPSPQGGRSPRH